MQKNLKFKTINLIFIGLLSALIVVGINGCKKKDTPPDTGGGGGGGGGGGTTATADYIKGPGFQINFTNPTRGTQSTNSVGDIQLSWKGNGTNDSSILLEIYFVRKLQAYTISDFSGTIKFGSASSAPSYSFKKGDLTFTQVNNLWVATLKNGTIEQSGNLTPIDNVEFKVTYPN